MGSFRVIMGRIMESLSLTLGKTLLEVIQGGE